MKKIIMFTAAAVIGLTLASPSFAAWGGMGGGKGQGNGMGMQGMMKCLDLTADQEKKINNDRNDMEKRLLQYRQDNRSVMIEIRQEMASKAPDRGKIERLMDKANANRSVMQKERLNYLFKVRSYLTPDQISKFSEQCMGRGMGKGRRGGSDW